MIQAIALAVSLILFMLGVIVLLIADFKQHGYVIGIAALLAAVGALATGGFLFVAVAAGGGA